MVYLFINWLTQSGINSNSKNKNILLQECILLHVQTAENCQHHFQPPVQTMNNTCN